MVKVRLSGLNKRRARGKWYVSVRATGEPVVKGFVGSRADLERHMRDHGLIEKYLNASRRASPRKHQFANGSVGAILDWYRSGECLRWNRLSDRTKSDYLKAIDGGLIESDLNYPARELNQSDIYRLRNRVHRSKWARMADNLTSVLSAAFGEAVKEGRMTQNPAKGVERVSSPDKNANREWLASEWQVAKDAAPDHLLMPLMIARHAGLRGIDIVPLDFKNIKTDPDYGVLVIDYEAASKNGHRIWMPIVPELRSTIASTGRHIGPVCVHSAGQRWKNENSLQKAVSAFLGGLRKNGLIGEGLTLHGLRVTFAAALKRSNGATNSEIADALADQSESMGKHYTRHVEQCENVLRAMGLKNRERT